MCKSSDDWSLDNPCDSFGLYHLSAAVQANAEHLSAELPLERGRSVLYPASTKAGSTLQVRYDQNWGCCKSCDAEANIWRLLLVWHGHEEGTHPLI